MDPGCVVISGVATARFLCMEGDGSLYSSVRINNLLSLYFCCSSKKFKFAKVIIWPKVVNSFSFSSPVFILSNTTADRRLSGHLVIGNMI